MGFNPDDLSECVQGLRGKIVGMACVPNSDGFSFNHRSSDTGALDFVWSTLRNGRSDSNLSYRSGDRGRTAAR
jgi:hypothetical protein